LSIGDYGAAWWITGFEFRKIKDTLELNESKEWAFENYQSIILCIPACAVFVAAGRSS